MTARFETIFLGAGPAGTGPLLAATRTGVATDWLRRGILWADQGPHIGPGALGRYAIASDTAAHVLLECLRGENNPLSSLQDDPLAVSLRTLGEGPVALQTAAAFLERVGIKLRGLVDAEPASAFWPEHSAVSLRKESDGSFVVDFANGRQAQARQVVMALGGYQDEAAARSAELLPGITLGQLAQNTLRLSGQLFAHGGLDGAIAALLARSRAPRIVIVGGSHSAVCAADLLLRSALGPRLPAGSIELWSRKVPQPFYLSAAAAHADGFSAFSEQDVCPVTGRVFRLAGLRMASRDLLRSILGLGNGPVERRVALREIQLDAARSLRHSLAQADLVVACLGYRPVSISFADATQPGRALGLGTSFATPRVDSNCRLLDACGAPIEHAYGIGLASGFVPSGPALGGEPSFRGQTNGIWLYQHDLGQMLLNQLRASSDKGSMVRGQSASSAA